MQQTPGDHSRVPLTRTLRSFMKRPVSDSVDGVVRAQARRRLIILGALWGVIATVLIVFRAVVLPFGFAALVAYIIAPLVRRLCAISIRRKSLPRWSGILLVYALFFLGTYLFLVALVPQLYRELRHFTGAAIEYAESLTPDRIRELSKQGEGWLSDQGIPVSLSKRAVEGETEGVPTPKPALTLNLEEIIHSELAKVTPTLNAHLGGIVEASRSAIVAIVAAVFSLFFILMLATFLSIDAEKFRHYVGSLIPREMEEDVRELSKRIDRSLSGVVRGQLTICLLNGTLTFVGLLIFGVKFAFLLATVATVFSLIPIFGSILSSVPIVLIALTQSWKKALAMLLWIIGVHQIEALFLNPKIMGSAAKIHPVVMAFALIAGERNFGLVGALLAPPVAAIIVGCFDYAREKAQPEAAPS